MNIFSFLSALITSSANFLWIKKIISYFVEKFPRLGLICFGLSNIFIYFYFCLCWERTRAYCITISLWIDQPPMVLHTPYKQVQRHFFLFIYINIIELIMMTCIFKFELKNISLIRLIRALTIFSSKMVYVLVLHLLIFFILIIFLYVIGVTSNIHFQVHDCKGQFPFFKGNWPLQWFFTSVSTMEHLLYYWT